MAATNVFMLPPADAVIAGKSADAGCSPTAPTSEPIGVPETPTNVLSSVALCPDNAIVIAPLIDDHLSECTQESHLSTCTVEMHVSIIIEETHVSLIAEDSMLNLGPLPVAQEGAFSRDGANMNPESISAHGLAQCVSVCSDHSNETHVITPDSVNRSPNEPMVDSNTPERIRLSAVSNRAAAGPGGDTGSYLHTPPHKEKWECVFIRSTR
jgi:hypothetical protein